MSALHFFPPEIRDTIIDEVAYEALSNSDSSSQFRQTLLSFHAASTVTRSRALKYIYKKIAITLNSNTQERIKTLRNLVEAPSSMVGVDHYIKEMALAFEMFPDYPPHPRLRRPTQLSPEDVMGNQDLVFLLQSFKKEEYGLRKLTVTIYPYNSEDRRSLNWKNLSSTFQSAFQNLIQSPHLLSLRIRGVSEMPISVLGNSHLRNLVMHQNVETQGEMDEITAKGYSSLETLSTNCVSLFRNSSHLSHAFQSLTELNFETRRFASRVTLLPLLLSCGHNLVKLTLGIQGRLEFDFQKLEIMPNLKAFAITSPRGAGSRVSKIQDVAHLLDVIRPMEHLEEITLQLVLCDDNGFGPFVDITHPGWQMIDSILSSEKYPKLHNVDVSVTASIVYTYFDEFDETQFLREGNAYLAQQLRRLEECPDVSFNWKLDCKSDILVGDREDEPED